MKIVCSANMPLAREAFETIGDVRVLDGRGIGAADVRDADILAIRSTTRVDRALLDGSRVRFVGTATIGYDHLDVDYLDEAGIRWCASPGCNANSVSEYLTAALLCLADRHGIMLAGKTIGVVGVGNVGRRVVEKAGVLGLRVLPNDPPRARRGEQCSRLRQGYGGQAGFRFQVSGDSTLKPETPPPAGQARHSSRRRRDLNPFWGLDEVLAASDIVTLHVPLSREGQDKTFHMADDSFFARLKPGAVFVNAARGAVVDTDALLRAMDDGRVAHAVIDTWEGEPAIRQDLLARADLGTPHIAGHSYEGKYNGTVMVYREACRCLGVEPTWTPEPYLPAPAVPRLDVEANGRSDTEMLRDVVRRVYAIEADDSRLREQSAATAFDAQRTNYAVRREFRFTTVQVRSDRPSLRRALRGLGFEVASEQDATQGE